MKENFPIFTVPLSEDKKREYSAQRRRELLKQNRDYRRRVRGLEELEQRFYTLRNEAMSKGCEDYREEVPEQNIPMYTERIEKCDDEALEFLIDENRILTSMLRKLSYFNRGVSYFEKYLSLLSKNKVSA